MVEYRTASFVITAKSHGKPIEEIDESLNAMAHEGWEVDQMSQSVASALITVIVVFKKTSAN